MKVFKAICLKDWTATAPIKGEEPKTDTVELKRGEEYTVSCLHDDGTRTVFTRYWFRAPDDLFGGVQPLNGELASNGAYDRYSDGFNDALMSVLALLDAQRTK